MTQANTIVGMSGGVDSSVAALLLQRSGESIAGLISHPPGVNRCEVANVCGPAGLIASARTSAGTMENLLSVNEGNVDSGFAQSDVGAAAVKGTGPFKAKGKQSHVRVIAAVLRAAKEG